MRCPVKDYSEQEQVQAMEQAKAIGKDSEPSECVGSFETFLDSCSTQRE